MNRKIFLVVFITLLSLLSMFSSVVGLYGDIGAATVSTFEWGPIEGRRPSVVRLGTSEFYLIAASNQTNPATWNTANITLWTIRVWKDNGTIKQSVIDKYKLDTVQRLAPELCHVYGDIYGVAYYLGDYRRIVTVKVWSSNGTIQKSWIDSVTISASFASSLYGAFFKLSGNMFVCSGPRAGAAGGTIDTIYIDNNGIMPATRNDTVTFEPTTTGGVSALAIDSDTIAVAYYNYTDNDGWIQTWNITPATGDIAAARTDIWEFDSVRGSQNFIHRIAGNVYAISYRDNDADGQIKTLTISPTGVITKAWIDTFEFLPADTISYSSIFTVNPGSVYGVGYMDAATDGWIKTMNITSAGDIGAAAIDLFEFDSADCQWWPRVIYVNKSYYLIVYPGTDTLTTGGTLYDGWACTVSITTNYATPTLTNPDPGNGSTGKPLTPILAITAADLNGDAMTLTWSSNSSGSWIQFGVNTSVANGTYRQHNNNFSAYNTKYWWRVNITDGLNTDYEIYSFSTFTPAPDASDPSPANGSTSESIPVTTCVNISSELLPCSINHERYEWYVPGPMSNSFFGKNFWNAQNFTVGTVGTNEDFYVTNITLELVKITGKTVGDVVVSIRSVIDGPDLCSGSIDGDLLIDDSTPPMLERINITMSPHILLSADTNYFIITRAPDAEDSSSAAWYYIFDTGAYPGGWFFTSNDAGVSWSDDTYNTSDHWFQVWGSTEIVCVTYSFWTNESGTWEQYGSGTACSNGTYCATNDFTEYNTIYYWSINLSINGNWTNATYHFTTEIPIYILLLFNEDPIDKSTVIYTFSTTTLTGSNMFNMSINRSHSGGLDMNTTIWFEGSLLFTNLTWGNGSIAFDLFDYWAGSLVNGTTYHWIVNASDNWGSYSNETLDFLFIVNASFGGVVISGAPVIIEEKNMMIGLCFIFFLCGTLILRSAAKKALKKK